MGNFQVFLQPILPVRFFSEGVSLTSSELEQRTLEVIKCFDKVDPDKVRMLFIDFSSSNLGVFLFLPIPHPMG